MFSSVQDREGTGMGEQTAASSTSLHPMGQVWRGPAPSCARTPRGLLELMGDEGWKPAIQIPGLVAQKD